MELNTFDLSTLSYEQFIEYFFTKPEGELWDLDFDGRQFVLQKLTRPETILHYLTQFFVEFRKLAEPLPLETLDSGITAMFSGAYFQLQSVLWNNSLDLPERIHCIRSMYRIFADFVANCKVEVLGACFYMWWDYICSSFWFEQTYERKLPTEDYNLLCEHDRMLLDAMFSTLVEILKLDDDRTQSYALHGLGHLHHPQVRAVVQEFINRRAAELQPDDLSWLEKCRDGTVM